jgi:hypothetical protein
MSISFFCMQVTNLVDALTSVFCFISFQMLYRYL